MRKAALLAASALALPLAFSFPAVAQQQKNAPPPAQQQLPMQQSQKQQPPAQQSQNTQTNNENNQSANNGNNGQSAQLSKDQIKQAQQALDKKGFHAGRQDGVLGHETKQALSKFQRSQKLQPTGQLDDQTLQALGISQNDNMTGAGTNGQEPSGQNQPPANQNNGPNNNPPSQK